MTVATGLSPAQVQTLIQTRLVNLRTAINSIVDLYRWTSGLSATDLATAAGLSQGDAAVYLSAVADANAEAQIHYTGQAPGTYPQVPAVPGPYVYSASQAQVIGPQ